MLFIEKSSAVFRILYVIVPTAFHYKIGRLTAWLDHKQIERLDRKSIAHSDFDVVRRIDHNGIFPAAIITPPRSGVLPAWVIKQMVDTSGFASAVRADHVDMR
jgi:hypothetical protein